MSKSHARKIGQLIEQLQMIGGVLEKLLEEDRPTRANEALLDSLERAVINIEAAVKSLQETQA